MSDQPSNNDELTLGARIDQLTRAVGLLSTRVDQQEEALVQRVDIVARRLSESAERVEGSLATADANVTTRLEQATTGVRARVEQVLAELRETMIDERAEADAAAAARAERVEGGIGELAELLPDLRELASSVGATASGLSVSASGLAGYVQDVLASTDKVKPSVDEALAGIEQRLFAAHAADSTSLTGRVDEATQALTMLGNDLQVTVEQAVTRSLEAAPELVNEAVLGQIEAIVGPTMERMREAVVAQIDAVRASSADETVSLRQVITDEIAALRAEATAQSAALREDVVTELGQQLDGSREELSGVASAMRSRGLETDASLRATVEAIGERLHASVQEQSSENVASVAELRSVVSALLDQTAAMEQQQQESLEAHLRELVGHREALSAQTDQLAGHSVELAGHREDVGRIGSQLVEAIAVAGDAQLAKVMEATEQQRVVLLETGEQQREAVLLVLEEATSGLSSTVAERAGAIEQVGVESRSMIVDAMGELREVAAALATTGERNREELLRVLEEATIGLSSTVAERSGAIEQVGVESRSMIVEAMGELRDAAAILATTDELHREELTQSFARQVEQLVSRDDELRASLLTELRGERETITEQLRWLDEQLRTSSDETRTVVVEQLGSVRERTLEVLGGMRDAIVADMTAGRESVDSARVTDAAERAERDEASRAVLEQVAEELRATLDQTTTRIETFAGRMDAHGGTVAAHDEALQGARAELLAHGEALDAALARLDVQLSAHREQSVTAAADLRDVLRVDLDELLAQNASQVAQVTASAAADLRTAALDDREQFVSTVNAELRAVTDGAVETAAAQLTAASVAALDGLMRERTDSFGHDMASLVEQVAAELRTRSDDVAALVATTGDTAQELAVHVSAASAQMDALGVTLRGHGDDVEATDAAMRAARQDLAEHRDVLAAALGQIDERLSRQREQTASAASEHHDALAAALGQIDERLSMQREQTASAASEFRDALAEALGQIDQRLSMQGEQTASAASEHRDALAAALGQIDERLSMQGEQTASAASEFRDALAAALGQIDERLSMQGEQTASAASEFRDALAAALGQIDERLSTQREQAAAGAAEIRDTVVTSLGQLDERLSTQREQTASAASELREVLQVDLDALLAEQRAGVAAATNEAATALQTHADEGRENMLTAINAELARFTESAVNGAVERLTAASVASVDELLQARTAEFGQSMAALVDSATSELGSRTQAVEALLSLTRETAQEMSTKLGESTARATALGATIAEHGDGVEAHSATLREARQELVEHGSELATALERLDQQLAAHREQSVTAAADLRDVLQVDLDELLAQQRAGVMALVEVGSDRVVAANALAATSLKAHADEGRAQLLSAVNAELRTVTEGAVNGAVEQLTAASVTSVEELLEARTTEFGERLSSLVEQASEDLRTRSDALAALLTEARVSVEAEGRSLRDGVALLEGIGEAITAGATATGENAATVASESTEVREQAEQVKAAADRVAQSMERANVVADALVTQVASEVGELSEARAGFQKLMDDVLRHVVDEAEGVRTTVVQRLDEESERGEVRATRIEAALAATGEALRGDASDRDEQLRQTTTQAVDTSTRAAVAELANLVQSRLDEQEEEILRRLEGVRSTQWAAAEEQIAQQRTAAEASLSLLREASEKIDGAGFDSVARGALLQHVGTVLEDLANQLLSETTTHIDEAIERSTEQVEQSIDRQRELLDLHAVKLDAQGEQLDSLRMVLSRPAAQPAAMRVIDVPEPVAVAAAPRPTTPATATVAAPAAPVRRTIRRPDGRGALRALVAAVDGIGPAKQNVLVERFGTVKALRAASVEELATLEGISESLAERLYAAAQRS